MKKLNELTEKMIVYLKKEGLEVVEQSLEVTEEGVWVTVKGREINSQIIIDFLKLNGFAFPFFSDWLCNSEYNLVVSEGVISEGMFPRKEKRTWKCGFSIIPEDKWKGHYNVYDFFLRKK